MTKSIVCLQPLTAQQQERIRAAAPGYTFTQGNGKNPDLQLLADAEIVIGWAKGIADTLLRPDSPFAGYNLGLLELKNFRLSVLRNVVFF